MHRDHIGVQRLGLGGNTPYIFPTLKAAINLVSTDVGIFSPNLSPPLEQETGAHLVLYNGGAFFSIRGCVILSGKRKFFSSF